MLNYYNPLLTEWIRDDVFWFWTILFHILMILVPGAIALVTEEPRWIGRRRKVYPLPLRDRQKKQPESRAA